MPVRSNFRRPKPWQALGPAVDGTNLGGVGPCWPAPELRRARFVHRRTGWRLEYLYSFCSRVDGGTWYMCRLAVRGRCAASAVGALVSVRPGDVVAEVG